MSAVSKNQLNEEILPVEDSSLVKVQIKKNQDSLIVALTLLKSQEKDLAGDFDYLISLYQNNCLTTGDIKSSLEKSNILFLKDYLNKKISPKKFELYENVLTQFGLKDMVSKNSDLISKLTEFRLSNNLYRIDVSFLLMYLTDKYNDLLKKEDIKILFNQAYNSFLEDPEFQQNIESSFVILLHKGLLKENKVIDLMQDDISIASLLSHKYQEFTSRSHNDFRNVIKQKGQNDGVSDHHKTVKFY